MYQDIKHFICDTYLEEYDQSIGSIMWPYFQLNLAASLVHERTLGALQFTDFDA